MRIPAEDLIGLGVIGFLLWWAFTHRGMTVVNQQAAVATPSTADTGLPRGNIYTAPPAPNLTVLNIPKFGGNPTTNQIVTSPAPCSCACDDGGASSQVTKTVADFTSSLTAALGNSYNTYIDNLLGAMPSYVSQFFVNPQLDNANAVLAKGASGTAANPGISDVTFTQHTDYSVSGGYLTGGGGLTAKDNYNINTFTPGRIVTIG